MQAESGVAPVQGKTVLEQFPWLAKQMPVLMPNINTYSSEAARDEMLELLSRDGLVQTTVEAVMGLRWVQTNLVSIMVGDLIAEQVMRLRATAGLVLEQESRFLKNQLDGLYKVNKSLLEMEAEGVMSRRARMELGASSNDALANALKEIADQRIPDHERVEAFLGGVPRAGKADVVDAQFELVDTREPEFAAEDWAELTQESKLVDADGG